MLEFQVWMIPAFLFSVLPSLLFLFSLLFAGRYQNGLIKKLLERENLFLQQNGKDNIHTITSLYPEREITGCGLVMTNISIGPSWWQMFVGGIKAGIFGGEVRSYDKILAWGRQEALQRLREVSKLNGWDDVINVRMETSMLQQTKGGNGKTGSIEIIAYGTGVR